MSHEFHRFDATSLTELFLWLSIACLALLPVFIVAFPSRGALSQVQQSEPYQWYEFVRMFLSWSVPPALAGVMLLAFRLSPNTRRAWMIPIAIIGVLASISAYLGESLGSLDCSSSCAAAVPTGPELLALVALMASLWVFLPLHIRRLSRG